MDNHFNKPIKRYIKDTKRLLACPKNYRRDFIADMEKDIQQFLLENSSAEYSDITSYFGTPAELAHLYLESIPPEKLDAYTVQKKRYTRFASITLFLILTFTILGLYAKLQEPQELDVIYIEETLEVEDK